ARLQSIFDDVQQMTLLGLPKWIDIVYGTNAKKVKTNADLLHALARGPVQEYGETNRLRGYGPLYVEASREALSVVGIRHAHADAADRFHDYFELAPPGSAAHDTFARMIAADASLRAAYGRELSTSPQGSEARDLVAWFLEQSVNPADLKRVVENL